MARESTILAPKRVVKTISTFLKYAVVTGANKGIGYEICRQLASNGILVVLTARDEKRGLDAVQKLKDSGISDDLVIYRQLDVVDPDSIVSLAEFVKNNFGKLDILVSNAGISGVALQAEAFQRAFEQSGEFPSGDQVWAEIGTQNYEMAEQCVKTNYYGARGMAEALAPLLQLSDSPRIVNVTSILGLLKNIPNEWAKGLLDDVENLNEDRIEEVVNEFLKDFKDDLLASKGWPTYLSAYIVSKAAMSAYTRILAKKYPSFRVNCLCPGYCKTDITTNTGSFTAAEGAENAVRLALLSDGGPSASPLDVRGVAVYLPIIYIEPDSCPVDYSMHAVVTGANKGLGWGIVKLQASKGLEMKREVAVEKLNESCLSDHVVFHLLDVMDPASIASLAAFIRSQYARLDILARPRADLHKTGAAKVNNAAISGTTIDSDALAASKITSTEGWPALLSAYVLSKAAMNAHTRILSKKYPNLCINFICPGFVKTDMSNNTGTLSVDEAAVYPVKLALLPDGGPSGLLFHSG
ncbi:hypothetical protein SADUNF_Sadunf02G0130700 [Salix dunnii]|uniref:(+)-neomenthol dehydrogenase-like n=1 Tax=Salix dunnii TaxID=1413687 RepID=A0A835N7Y9_9ROSI|nr:hypothetical protein SADUNF_Sadunf02G0130700 [Salix dunnii]